MHPRTDASQNLSIHANRPTPPSPSTIPQTQSLIQTGLTYQLLRLVKQEEGEEGAQQRKDKETNKKKRQRSSSSSLLPGQPPEPADPLGSLMFLAQLVESAVGTLVTVRGRPFR